MLLLQERESAGLSVFFFSGMETNWRSNNCNDFSTTFISSEKCSFINKAEKKIQVQAKYLNKKKLRLFVPLIISKPLVQYSTSKNWTYNLKKVLILYNFVLIWYNFRTKMYTPQGNLNWNCKTQFTGNPVQFS